MKNLYALALGLVGLVGTTHAQSELDKKIEQKNYLGETTPMKIERTQTASRGTQSCIDTVTYAFYRSRNSSGNATYANVGINGNSSPGIKSVGLFFPTNGQDVSITGFQFLGYGRKADGSPSSVSINIYEATADSLPTGTPLGTHVVSLDTNNQTFGDIFNEFTFSSPINTTSSFVITAELGANDSAIIVTGAVLSGGADNYPTSYEISSGWLRPRNASQLGAIIPRFQPIISYTAENTLSSSVTELTNANETVDFTVGTPSIVNSYLTFSKISTNSNTSHLDFGDGNSKIDATASESHTYVDETSDYTVTLTDSIVLYRNTDFYCIVKETLKIDKAKPNSVLDVANGKFVAYAAQGQIFTANAIGKARLFNLTGSVVKEVELTNQFDSFNVSDLNEGVYILEVNEKAVKLKL